MLLEKLQLQNEIYSLCDQCPERIDGVVKDQGSTWKEPGKLLSPEDMTTKHPAESEKRQTELVKYRQMVSGGDGWVWDQKDLAPFVSQK